MIEEKIGIVIVNYNGGDLLEESIYSIKNQKFKNYIIFVVDGNSNDNSISYIKEKYEEDIINRKIVILEQEENVGVARGNNIGIKESIKSGCDYVLLLNNDVELDENMLGIMVNKANKDTIIVPKIYYFDNKKTIWMAGGYMDWRRGQNYHIGENEIDVGQYNCNRYINYAPTCSMLIHVSVLQKIGLEDEALFMYWDDTDICVRMVEQGFKILYVPSAFMWHKVSSSSGGSSSKVFVYYFYRNQLYFLNTYKEKCKISTYLFVYTKLIIKFVLSRLGVNVNNYYIREAVKDYRKGIMGRKEFK